MVKHYDVKEQGSQIVLRRSDAVGSLNIWGHNNQVLVEAGLVLPLVIINGFDNILTPLTDSANGRNRNAIPDQTQSQLRIKRLVVQGHNNRFKGLIANEITVNGHNNHFSDIVHCQAFADHGRNTSLELRQGSWLTPPDQRGVMTVTLQQSDSE